MHNQKYHDKDNQFEPDAEGHHSGTLCQTEDLHCRRCGEQCDPGNRGRSGGLLEHDGGARFSSRLSAALIPILPSVSMVDMVRDSYEMQRGGWDLRVGAVASTGREPDWQCTVGWQFSCASTFLFMSVVGATTACR